MCSLIEYQHHLNWSAAMVEYVNELPKLSVELDQLIEHKRELEVSHNMDHCMTTRHDNTVTALLFKALIFYISAVW